ncbi:MAG TPA: GNAT family N-acetyltransferase [Arthrobacter sp.]|nr:GNAT family N-acetyltransferase [Arthrobacter sp.]
MAEKETPYSVVRLDASHSAEILDLAQSAYAFDDVDWDPSYMFDAFEWERTEGVWVPDPISKEARLVGMGVVFSRRIKVPGGDIPVGAVSWGAVHPDARRGGILRALIDFYLDEVRSSGKEAITALFASEGSIYGRFGFGLATRSAALRLSPGAALRQVAGAENIKLKSTKLDETIHEKGINQCRETNRLRPGSISAESHQSRELFYDPARHRIDAEAKRIVIACDKEGLTDPWLGYAVFRRSRADGRDRAIVYVEEIVAADAPTARTLWNWLLNLDLVDEIRTGARPTDDPLLILLENAREAPVQISDGLYIRIIDVAKALSARTYACDVNVTISVRDELRPHWGGAWRLTAQAGREASCMDAKDSTPDLSCEVRELGSAYLGGTTWTAMVVAGLVQEHRAGAAAELDKAFHTNLAPHHGVTF